MPVIGRLAAKESALQAEEVLTSLDLFLALSLSTHRRGGAQARCELRAELSREDIMGER